jgi:hypothetical protein
MVAKVIDRLGHRYIHPMSGVIWIIVEITVLDRRSKRAGPGHSIVIWKNERPVFRPKRISLMPPDLILFHSRPLL